MKKHDIAIFSVNGGAAYEVVDLREKERSGGFVVSINDSHGEAHEAVERLWPDAEFVGNHFESGGTLGQWYYSIPVKPEAALPAELAPEVRDVEFDGLVLTMELAVKEMLYCLDHDVHKDGAHSAIFSDAHGRLSDASFWLDVARRKKVENSDDATFKEVE